MKDIRSEYVKLKNEYEDKIISIPFEDICLNQDMIGTTTEGIQETGIKEGDVFEWKENGSHWIVFLKRLEETAYFRADIRRCRYEITLDNGNKYWGCIRGPVEQQILWSQTSGNYYNNLLNPFYNQQQEELKRQQEHAEKIAEFNRTDGMHLTKKGHASLAGHLANIIPEMVNKYEK